MLKLIALFLVLNSVLACSSGGDDSADDNTASDASSNTTPVTGGTWYKPTPLVTWQWQLSGTVNTSYAVEIYDIDLFDVSISIIDQLQAAGKKVICYFSAGSYENWRPDEADFDMAVLGNNLDGWPGERWLDIRAANVRSIMQARLDLAVQKGCDGVEPDNMDGYTNNPGFSLTATDQLDYNRFIANEAHSRNLSVGLKNDLDQIVDLVDYYDFAVNEQCFEYNECSLLQPFISANKAVLSAEYKASYKSNMTERNNICADANSSQLSTLVLSENLDDSYRDSCN